MTKTTLPEPAYRPQWDKGYFKLNKQFFSTPALISFIKLLTLVRHGAGFIDVHVRKDGQEYHFQFDALKHMEDVVDV